jgi:hypothetical protein
MNGVFSDMPKQSDRTKKQLVIPATDEKIVDTNTYNSQRRAIRKYTDKIQDQKEQLKIWLPKGSSKVISDYVNAKALDDPTDTNYSTYTGKYWKPSTTAFIRYLIERELGLSLETLVENAVADNPDL